MSSTDRTLAYSLLLLTSALVTASEAPKELADANGCKFVLPRPVPPQVELKWDGSCAEGHLSGPGTADLGFITYKGRFDRGLMPHGEVTNSVGLKYVGELLGNEPRGQGELQLPSGTVVRARFRDLENVDGAGEISWPNGTRYTGEIVGRRTMQGKGKLVLADGNVYEGDFLEDRFHGQGKALRPNGDIYEGEFAHGKFHGHGTLIASNGDRYVGEFVDGQRHGKGRRELADGTAEEGEWNSGQLHGECHVRYALGNEYTGQCLNGQLSGQGKYRNAADDSVYEGTFVASKIHGRGRLTRGDFSYEGEFVDGVRSGQGKEVLPTGEQYEGTFVHGIRDGNGVLRRVTPNGTEVVYEGQFEKGIVHGSGKMTTGGATFDGEFRGGVFVKGRVREDSGRSVEIDIDQGAVFEIRPDGAKVPLGTDQTLETPI